MTVRAHLPAYESLHVLRNASVRTGVYVGIILSIVFSGWVIVANHVPSLDRFALARNLAAVILLGLVALIPILRFGACRVICWLRAWLHGAFSAWPIGFCAWISEAWRSASVPFRSSCSALYSTCLWFLFPGYGLSSGALARRTYLIRIIIRADPE